MWTYRIPPLCWGHPYCLVSQTSWLSHIQIMMSALRVKVCCNCNLCVLFPGTRSVLPHGDAGPFPVSITGSSESPARGSVLPGRGSCPGPRALCQCPLPKLWPWAPYRAGRSFPLMERCSWGMQPQPQDFSRSKLWKCVVCLCEVKKKQLATHSWKMPTICDFQSKFPISSFLGCSLSVNLHCYVL